MPTFHVHELQELSANILQAAGTPPQDAQIVAEELAEANLLGHDSHGVIRLMQYVSCVEQGQIRPGSGFEVVQEGPAYALADGKFDFGQVSARKALALGIQKANEAGTATVLLRNGNHVGRLGSYTERAAREGFVALMVVNAPAGGGVAPFGGIEGRLGTNPLSIAAPWGNEALVLDMTTSATAEGKLRVAYQKGERIAEGLLIDAQGRPTTDPAAFYANPPGALLPLGGALGFKGYGLAVMIDVLAGIVSGSGVFRDDLPRGANGVWMQLIAIDRFISRAEYDRWLERYVERIRSTPRAPGVEEILLPGEIEQRRKQQRLQDGIDVPEATWRQIGELAARLGVPLPG